MKKYISYRTTNLITHGQSPQPMVSKYCSLCDIQSKGLLGVPHSAMRVSPCQVVRDIRVVKHHIFMYAATSQGRREMKWGLPVIYWLVYNNNYNNIIQNAGNNLVYLSIPLSITNSWASIPQQYFWIYSLAYSVWNIFWTRWILHLTPFQSRDSKYLGGGGEKKKLKKYRECKGISFLKF